MADSIVNLMLKEHKIINELLSYFEDIIEEDFSDSKNVFSKLNWDIEKHFFIEERAIFKLYPKNNLDKDIKRLLDEHKKITNLLDLISEEISNGKKPSTHNLKTLLSNHSRFENDTFYPRLENELNEEEKILIIERVKEIIEG